VLYLLESDASGAQFLADEFYRSSAVEPLFLLPCCKYNMSSNEHELRKYFRLVVELFPKTIDEFRSSEKK